jgi:hypothetical protein
MAKRTKRATAGKAKTPRKASKKVGMKAKTPTKRAAKRSLKTKAKRQKTRARSGRSRTQSGAKKSASRQPRTPTQQETPQPEMMIVETAQTDTTIVDVIEEPVPGVFVVTEFVETNAEPEPTDSRNIDQGAAPESEE